MKKRMNQFVAIALLISLTITFGCEKEKEDQAPQLPPLSTFAPDLSYFDEGAEVKKTTETSINIGFAYVAVIYWGHTLYTSLAVPVASYIEAFNHDAVRVDNDTWEWSYEVIKDEVTYMAVLTADVIGDIINWEMRISQEEGFTDFLWYSGSCNTIRTEGTWTLYFSPDDPTEFVDVAWNVDYEEETSDVTYTVIKTGHDYEDSYLTYGKTNTDPSYDVYYVVYDSAQEISYEIYYNTITHEGKIIFGEYEGCWDGSLQDITCPVL